MVHKVCCDECGKDAPVGEGLERKGVVRAFSLPDGWREVSEGNLGEDDYGQEVTNDWLVCSEGCAVARARRLYATGATQVWLEDLEGFFATRDAVKTEEAK